jgi:pre-mRNA-splicing helicase BRR2
LIQKNTKIKDVTWWVLIGDNQNNLLALKKVSIRRRVELKIQIDVPEDLTHGEVSVYLLSDSYIGLDQVQKINFKTE